MALNESSGTEGGNTVPENEKPAERQPENEEQKPGDKERVKGAIGEVCAHHHPDGEPGHVYHYNHEKAMVHHSHPEGCAPEKLKPIADDLGKIEGVKGVHQEANKSQPDGPDKESWEHIFGINKAEDAPAETPAVEDKEPKDQPTPESEEQREKAISLVKSMSPADLAKVLKAIDPGSGGGSTGEVAGGMNKHEDGADETPDNMPFGVHHALKTIEMQKKSMPRHHPNDRMFYGHMTGMVNEHAADEYPGHANLFETSGVASETGGESALAPKEGADTGATAEAATNEADRKRTEEVLSRYSARSVGMLERYPSYIPILANGIFKRMKKGHTATCRKMVEHLGDLSKLSVDKSFTSTHKAMSSTCYKEGCAMLKEMEGASDDGDVGDDDDMMTAGASVDVLKDVGRLLSERLPALTTAAVDAKAKPLAYKMFGRKEDHPDFDPASNGFVTAAN
jgi:hypothetical protein